MVSHPSRDEAARWMGHTLAFETLRASALVEVVGGDVVKDGFGEAGVVLRVAELLAKLGGAEVDIEAGKQIERSGLAVGVFERGALELDVARRGDGRGRRGERETCGEDGCEVGEGLARARGNDEGRGERQFGSAMPAREAEKGVGAEEAEDLGVGMLAVEVGEGVDGVVGVRAWGVGEREREGWVVGDGKARHGDAVVERRGGAGGLERLVADRREEDLIERERETGGAGHGEVAGVGWIEAAAEECDAHGSMVARTACRDCIQRTLFWEVRGLVSHPSRDGAGRWMGHK